MYKTFALVLVNLSLSLFAAAQPHPPQPGPAPLGLMCDLLAYTDYQSEGGYPMQPVWTTEAFSAGQAVRIRNARPAFSWALPPVNGQQAAFQILVATHPDTLAAGRGNVWDSGKITGAQSAAVRYQGQELQAFTLYCWQVRVWDQEDRVGPYSAPSAFCTDSLSERYITARYPLQKTDEIPRKLLKAGDTFRVDFGRAAFGQLKLTLDGAAGDTIVVHLGEAVQPDGRIDPKPSGSIRYQRYLLPLRPGTYTYQINIKPDKRNTGAAAIKMPGYIGEVLPFRYAAVEGYQGTLEKEQVVRVAVHYPFDDTAASFHSSDSILNAVWELCRYSIKATSFAGIYVDGDRERIPYEADAYINQLCHYAVDREFSMARYSHEYLIRNATWPTEWILQSVLMAWNDYLYTGDIRSARMYYHDLKAKTLTDLEDPNGLISTRTGRQDSDLMKRIHFRGKEVRDIVDWPHTGILGLGKAEGGETDGFVFTDYNAVVNAYYYKALTDMAALADAVGEGEDAVRYRNKAVVVKTTFQRHFRDKKRGIVRDGIGTDHTSLHANMFALAFGLVEEKDKPAVRTFIRSRGMACSVYGSQFLMDAVYDAGDADYGLALLTSQDERSWYNMIRAGSTVTMEAWDNKYKPNQDWNHAWGAVPANIIPRKLMGIEPLTPGWATFRIRPQPGNLSHAAVKVPSVKGDIIADYKKTDSGYILNVEIPGNTTALVEWPAVAGKPGIRVNGEPVSVKKAGSVWQLPPLEGGSYRIEANRSY